MKVVVRCADKKVVYDVTGKDAFFEAAKKFVIDGEKAHTKENPFLVSCVIECYDKKWIRKKHMIFNTYFVLVAVNQLECAERLRDKFLRQFGIDVAKEPDRSKCI